MPSVSTLPWRRWKTSWFRFTFTTVTSSQRRAKSIGGLNYFFDLRGSHRKDPTIVPAAQQREALHAILKTLSPQELAVPQAIAGDHSSASAGVLPLKRKLCTRRTSPAFDSLAPAEAAADIVVRLLLQPERAQRLIEYHSHDANNPGFDELLDTLLASTWKANHQQDTTQPFNGPSMPSC